VVNDGGVANWCRETIADLLSRDGGSLERPPLTRRAAVNSGCEALLYGE
jgi:hypothetical protein